MSHAWSSIGHQASCFERPCLPRTREQVRRVRRADMERGACELHEGYILDLTFQSDRCALRRQLPAQAYSSASLAACLRNARSCVQSGTPPDADAESRWTSIHPMPAAASSWRLTNSSTNA